MSCFFNKQSWLLLFALTTPLHFQWLADLTVSGKKLPSQTVLLSVPELSMYCYCFVFKRCLFWRILSALWVKHISWTSTLHQLVWPHNWPAFWISWSHHPCVCRPTSHPSSLVQVFIPSSLDHCIFQLILCPVYIYIPIFIYHVEEFF